MWGGYGRGRPLLQVGVWGRPPEDYFENNTKMVHSKGILGRIPTSKALCNTLLHICLHSHSPPLIRHYVSYLISTFAETTPGHMTPTHLSHRVKSQCELVTIFLRRANLTDIFSLTPCEWQTQKSISQIFRPERGLNPGPSDHQLCVLPLFLEVSCVSLYMYMKSTIFRRTFRLYRPKTVFFLESRPYLAKHLQP